MNNSALVSLQYDSVYTFGTWKNINGVKLESTYEDTTSDVSSIRKHLTKINFKYANLRAKNKESTWGDISHLVMLDAGSIIKSLQVSDCRIPVGLNNLSFKINPSSHLSHMPSSIYESLTKRIEGFTNKYEVAEGVDIIPPSAKAIDNSLFFIENNLRRIGFSEPMINKFDDGEINIFWDNKIGLVDVAIFGNDMYAYYAKNKKTGIETYGDEKITTKFPSELLELIRVN